MIRATKSPWRGTRGWARVGGANRKRSLVMIPPKRAIVKQLPENERFLLDLANEAKARGDFAGYERARRAFLLAQASRY